MADDDLIFRTLDLDDPAQAGLRRGWIQSVLRGFLEDRADDAFAERWLGYCREDGFVLRGAWPRSQPVGSTDVPVATFASWSGEMHVGGGARLPIHLITDVVVTSTHRRRGLMTRLMVEDLGHAVAEGRPLAALTASEGLIYGRYGFGTATRVHHVEVDVSRGFALRPEAPVADGELVLAAPTESGDVTLDVWARFHAATRGSIDRPSFYRQFTHDNLDFGTRSPDPKSHRCVLVGPDGVPEGFVTYRHDGEQDGRSVVVVRDLVAASLPAYLRLWQYLADLDLIERITWNRSPVVDPLTWALADPRRLRIVRENDFLWLRVLDVVTALEARPWGADGSVVLDVADPQGHAAGHWRVEVVDGAAKVARTDDAADVALTADTLGALYLGGIDSPTLAAVGRLRGEPDAVARWTAMADVAPLPYCPTGF